MARSHARNILHLHASRVRSLGIWLHIGLLNVVVLTGLAEAQTCPVEPYELLMPQGLAAGDQYGYSMATTGDWLFVGAPMDDQLGTDAGAVYVFQIDGGMYEFRQKLLATGGVGAAHFGFSLAADGDAVIVGAENDQDITQKNSSAWGAAYMFQLNAQNVWVQEQKLFAFDADPARRFGYAVALNDDVAVVGTRLFTSNGVNNPGAAFIYRFDGASWLPEQRVMADVPTNSDNFGFALAISDSRLAVGSRQSDEQALNAGSVFTFEHNGQAWVQSGMFFAPDPTSGAWFGHAVAMHEDTIVVGAPQATTPTSPTGGAAYIFNWNGNNWVLQQKLVGHEEDKCGSALTMSRDFLLVGAPERYVVDPSFSSFQVGAAYVYRMSDGVWVYDRFIHQSQPQNYYDAALYRCWEYGPPPINWPPNTDSGKLGIAVATSSVGLLASSVMVREQCWRYVGPWDSGAVNVFGIDYVYADCNANGVPDPHELGPDCNGDNVPNECDFANGSNIDCNSNNLLDECDTGFRYQLSSSFGYVAWHPSPSTGNADFIWLNQFRVKPGGQVITHIALERSGFIPMGSPVWVMLYADPNQDGDPTDAKLISVTETRTVSFEVCVQATNWRTIVPITPVYVGPPGTFFFIGGVVRPTTIPPPQHYWAAATSIGVNAGQVRRSWWAAAPPGQADIEDLANNATRVRLFPGGPWSLRAVAADCNMNGIWDQCDIDSGFSMDLNANGIPDECDDSECIFADMSPHLGDGQVNVTDLVHVINNWGVCNPCFAICEGDATDDCAVGVPDLLKVINNWGPCP